MLLNIKHFLLLILAFLFTSINVFAYDAITIDGVTYSDYAILSNTKTGDNVFDNFQLAIDSSFDDIIIDEDTFYVDSIIRLTRDNVNIIGYSKDNSKIVQTNPTKDLLQVYANNTTVKNITLDTKTYSAYAAYVVGDGSTIDVTDHTLRGNNNTIENCNILGGNKGFTFYLAGPTYKNIATFIDGYENGNLHSGNKVINNYFEGNNRGDSFVFALQKDSIVTGNTFKNGQVNIFVSDGLTLDNNLIDGSNLSGLFISSPSKNIIISNNTIKNTIEHGIKVDYQRDHLGMDVDYYYSNNISILNNNLLNIGFTAMDLAYFMEGAILDNIIDGTAEHGISLIRYCEDNDIFRNKIENFGLVGLSRGSGIFIAVAGKKNKFEDNIIYNIGNLTYSGILIETSDSSRNTFKNNTVEGLFTHAAFYTYVRYWSVTRSNILNNYIGEDYIYEK